MNLKKYKNDKTIILISHNTDDLKICDKIYDLEKILNLNCELIFSYTYIC